MDFSFFLFFVGLFGILVNKRHLLIIFLALELLFLAVSFNFVCYYVVTHDVSGLVMALFLLGLAAAESAIGLALLILYSRFNTSIMIDSLSKLKG